MILKRCQPLKKRNMKKSRRDGKKSLLKASLRKLNLPRRQLKNSRKGLKPKRGRRLNILTTKPRIGTSKICGSLEQFMSTMHHWLV